MSKSIFSIDKGKLEVRIERVYDTSPERLYEAHTNPDQIIKWWGPRGYETVIDKMDVEVGGAWRIVQKDLDGKEHAFSGVFKEIEKPNKLVRTFEYEPMPGHVLIESVEFRPLSDTQTKLTSVSHYDNLDDLNGMVSMGMEDGATESQDRLAELVES